MKTHVLAAALGLFAFAATPVLAQSGHMHHDHAAAPAAGQGMGMSEGVVKKVDKAAGKLTIAHGPLENLGMPGMTMAFPVKNTAQLDAVKVGDKIRLRAEQQNGSIVVTAIEAAK